MIEMLNRSGWLVTRPELNHPNPELVRTTPNPAHNRSYRVGGSYRPVQKYGPVER